MSKRIILNDICLEIVTEKLIVKANYDFFGETINVTLVPEQLMLLLHSSIILIKTTKGIFEIRRKNVITGANVFRDVIKKLIS